MATIMVVDDDESVAHAAAGLLREDGHQVLVLSGGEEALRVLSLIAAPGSRTPRPDLLVLDVQMPGLDGYSICARLQDEGSLRGTPFIVATAKRELEDLFRGFPSFRAYLRKPYEPQSLRECVRRALGAEGE